MLRIEILPGTGAEVTGVNLAELTSDEFAQIRQAFCDNGLLLFRDQSLDETQHINFAERFGTINVNRFFTAHNQFPQIALVSKEPDQVVNIGGGWHTDHSYDVEPAMGSILVAKELPDTGGDTWFTSMYGAWDCLSTGLQETLLGLNAVHSAKHVFGSSQTNAVAGADLSDRLGNQDAADSLENVVHPAVIKHPLSGRHALYVNPGFTLQFEGWSREDSLPLLQYLYEVARQDKLTTRFQWKPGSVAFWDNRATWHFAQNDYQGQRREMHRITIEGCALAAAKAAA